MNWTNKVTKKDASNDDTIIINNSEKSTLLEFAYVSTSTLMICKRSKHSSGFHKIRVHKS